MPKAAWWGGFWVYVVYANQSNFFGRTNKFSGLKSYRFKVNAGARLLFRSLQIQLDVHGFGNEFIAEGFIVAVIHLPLPPVYIEVGFAFQRVAIVLDAGREGDIFGFVFQR